MIFLICPFASSFIFELHSANNGLNFVKLIYNGEEITSGLNKSLVYDKVLGGYKFDSFLSFINSRIDPYYKQLFCETDGGDDELMLKAKSNFHSRYLKDIK